MSAPKLSIVIPTRANVPIFSACLEAVYSKTRDAEIIVVTNGEKEHTRPTYRYVTGLEGVAPLPTKVIHSFKEGPVAAINQGLKEAQGKFLCILHDDVIVSSGWIDCMMEARRVASITSPEVRWGFFGPLSNGIGGRQHVDVREYPEAGDPSTAEQMATRLIREGAPTGPRPLIQPTGALGLACLLMTREAYDAVGGLDEQFGPMGDYADHDLIHRGQLAGFLALIANRSFVFHHAGTARRRFYPELATDGINRDVYLKKWREHRDRTVCATYRVKIDTAEDWSLFVESVKRVHGLADWAVLVDDRSEVDIQEELLAEGLEQWFRKVHKNLPSAGLDEVRDRNILLRLARETEPDWIWNVDADELPPSRFTRDDLQRLVNPVNPAVKGYSLPIMTLWRGETRVRFDGAWAEMASHSLFRNLPAWGDTHPAAKGAKFHCRRMPTNIPDDNVSPTAALSMKHFGCSDPAAVERKIEFYEREDLTKEQRLIGARNYRELYAEENLGLLPYSEQTVALVFLVRKHELLDGLRLLMAYSPVVHESVVVVTDAGTEFREDMQLYSDMGARVFGYACCPESTDPEHMLCDFAAARNYAIEQVQSDYLLFLDPDEQLQPQGPRLLSMMLLHAWDCYLCQVNNYHVEPGKPPTISVHTLPRLFRNRPELRYEDEVHETLEKSMELVKGAIKVGEVPLVVDHWGFTKTDPEARARRNAAYAAKLTKILERNPRDARALVSLGVYMNSLGQVDDGDPMLMRALKLSPEYYTARLEVAMRLTRRALEVLLAAPPGSIPPNKRGEVGKRMAASLASWFPDIAQKLGVPTAM